MFNIKNSCFKFYENWYDIVYITITYQYFVIQRVFLRSRKVCLIVSKQLIGLAKGHLTCVFEASESFKIV